MHNDNIRMRDNLNITYTITPVLWKTRAKHIWCPNWVHRCLLNPLVQSHTGISNAIRQTASAPAAPTNNHIPPTPAKPFFPHRPSHLQPLPTASQAHPAPFHFHDISFIPPVLPQPVPLTVANGGSSSCHTSPILSSSSSKYQVTSTCHIPT